MAFKPRWWKTHFQQFTRELHLISFHNRKHLTSQQMEAKQSALSLHLSGSISASNILPRGRAFSHFHFPLTFIREN